MALRLALRALVYIQLISKACEMEGSMSNEGDRGWQDVGAVAAFQIRCKRGPTHLCHFITEAGAIFESCFNSRESWYVKHYSTCSFRLPLRMKLAALAALITTARSPLNPAISQNGVPEFLSNSAPPSFVSSKIPAPPAKL